jgi:hypothetical protein
MSGGQQLYEIWAGFMASQNIECPAWVDLEEHEQIAWEKTSVEVGY